MHLRLNTRYSSLVSRQPAKLSMPRRPLHRDLKALLEKGLLSDAGAAPTDPTRHYQLADGIGGSGAGL